MRKLGAGSVHTEFLIPGGHGWITDSFGHDCNNLFKPWINNCQFNMAYDMFEYFNGIQLDPTPYDL